MKNLEVEFVIAGTRELRRGWFKNTTPQKVFNYITEKFGFVEHFQYIEF